MARCRYTSVGMVAVNPNQIWAACESRKPMKASPTMITSRCGTGNRMTPIKLALSWVCVAVAMACI